VKRLLAAAGCLAGCFAAAPSASAAVLQVSPANAAFPQRALTVSGQGLIGLSPSRVHVVENGVPVRRLIVRPLKQASGNDFGIVLVIDVSPTATAIERAVATARSLAADRPTQGLLGVVEADAAPPIALGLTGNAAAINGELAKVPVISHHGLHVYNAVQVAIGMLSSAKVAAASVIVLSDGADRGNPTTLRALTAAASAAHIRIFSVGIASPNFDAQPLTSLASLNGGHFYETGASQLGQIFTSIESSLSSAYLIRYRSGQRPGVRIAASISIAGQPASYDISYTTPASAAISSGPPPVTRHSSFWTSAGALWLVSIACAVMLGLAVIAVVRRPRSVRQRVGSFVDTGPLGEADRRRTLVERALGDPRRRVNRSGRLAELYREMELAQISLPLGSLALLTAAGTVLVGLLLGLATSSPIAGLLGLAVPVGVRLTIRVLADRQRSRFDEQLPDNLQIIATAMRAGHTFGGALAVVVDDAPEPSRRELRRALADEQLGVPLADSLADVGARMRSSNFEHVALVARLQRDTGGNTAEVLDLVTETIRERIDLRRLVRTLTAQGRLAGIVVSLLPVVLLIAISLINPHYLHPLFHTVAGVFFLVLGIVMMIAGGLIMRRIVDIEI
jgi:tight adherence protein B